MLIVKLRSRGASGVVIVLKGRRRREKDARPFTVVNIFGFTHLLSLFALIIMISIEFNQTETEKRV